MTWVRATKTPPAGGVRARSRSAKRPPSSVRASQDPLTVEVHSTTAAPPRISTGTVPVEMRTYLADGGGDGGEEAVDEAAGLVGGVALGQLDGLAR